jgi:regulatory protein
MEKKITALTLQKQNRDRVNVFLNDEFAFGLSKYVAAWLKVGQVLGEEKIAQLLADDEIEVSYQRALKFLAHRIRSKQEVVQRLRKYQTPADVVEVVLSRLEEKEYLNDEAFARAWVENRIEFRPRSTYLLRQELRQKGVEDVVIDVVLETLDDESLAQSAAEKYLRKIENMDDEQKFREKLYGHLARKGFTYATVADILTSEWQKLHDEIE